VEHQGIIKNGDSLHSIALVLPVQSNRTTDSDSGLGTAYELTLKIMESLAHFF
jgi:hypothetical protein